MLGYVFFIEYYLSQELFMLIYYWLNKSWLFFFCPFTDDSSLLFTQATLMVVNHRRANALQYAVSVPFVLREIPTGTTKHPSHRSRSWNAQGPRQHTATLVCTVQLAEKQKAKSFKARHCACAAWRVGSYPLNEGVVRGSLSVYQCQILTVH